MDVRRKGAGAIPRTSPGSDSALVTGGDEMFSW